MDLKMDLGFDCKMVNSSTSLVVHCSVCFALMMHFKFDFAEVAEALAESMTDGSTFGMDEVDRKCSVASSRVFLASLTSVCSTGLNCTGFPSSVYLLEALAAEERRSFVADSSIEKQEGEAALL